jgi:hypothetical protein
VRRTAGRAPINLFGSAAHLALSQPCMRQIGGSARARKQRPRDRWSPTPIMLVRVPAKRASRMFNILLAAVGSPMLAG